MAETTKIVITEKISARLAELRSDSDKLSFKARGKDREADALWARVHAIDAVIKEFDDILAALPGAEPIYENQQPKRGRRVKEQEPVDETEELDAVPEDDADADDAEPPEPEPNPSAGIHKRKADRNAEVLANLDSGMSVNEVAEAMQIPPHTIYAIRRKRRVAEQPMANTEEPDDDPDDEPRHPAIIPTASSPVRGGANGTDTYHKEISPTELEMMKNRVEILLKSAKRLTYSQILSGCHLSPGQFAAVLRVAAIEKNDEGMYQLKSRKA